LIANIVEQGLNSKNDPNRKSTGKFKTQNEYANQPPSQEPSFSKNDSYVVSKRDDNRKTNENKSIKKRQNKDKSGKKSVEKSFHMNDCNDISLIPVKLNNSLLSNDDNKTERMNNSVTTHNIKHNEFFLEHMKCERSGMSQINKNIHKNVDNNKFILEDVKDRTLRN